MMNYFNQAIKTHYIQLNGFTFNFNCDEYSEACGWMSLTHKTNTWQFAIKLLMAFYYKNSHHSYNSPNVLTHKSQHSSKNLHIF